MRGVQIVLEYFQSFTMVPNNAMRHVLYQIELTYKVRVALVVLARVILSIFMHAPKVFSYFIPLHR